MSTVVLDDNGLAVIFNRASGSVLSCSVPTALENVANGRGVWVHGATGEPWDGRPEPDAKPIEVEPIKLTQDDVLPLPAAETAVVIVDDLSDVRTTPGDSAEKLEAIEREVDEANAAPAVPAKPARSTDPERKAILAELRAKKVSFFAGASTEKLKEILATS